MTIGSSRQLVAAQHETVESLDRGVGYIRPNLNQRVAVAHFHLANSVLWNLNGIQQSTNQISSTYPVAIPRIDPNPHPSWHVLDYTLRCLWQGQSRGERSGNGGRIVFVEKRRES